METIRELLTYLYGRPVSAEEARTVAKRVAAKGPALLARPVPVLNGDCHLNLEQSVYLASTFDTPKGRRVRAELASVESVH